MFFVKLFVKRNTPQISSNKTEVMISLVFLGKISIQIKKKIQYIFRDCGPGLKLKSFLNLQIDYVVAFRSRTNYPERWIPCYYTISRANMQLCLHW